MKTVYKGELYYADLSPAIGSEQSGIRPVLVIQNSTGNKHSPTTLVTTLTARKYKRRLPTHVQVITPTTATVSTVLLEQIRTIDKSRLKGYIGYLDKHTMKQIDRAIMISFGLKQEEL